MSRGLRVLPKILLNNGLEIPALALGTYLGFDQNGVMESKDRELQHIVENAIDIGYRHFDTATVYKTEEEIGRAIKNKIDDGTIERKDVFVTTKLWNTEHGAVETALRESLKKLDLSYVDLYLMHWPIGLHANYSHSDIDYVDTWKAMEELQKAGLAKSIGVSNFNVNQLTRLMQKCDVKPAVLQIEVHPNLIQEELISFCKQNNIAVMAYSPFGPLVDRYGLDLPPPKINDTKLEAMAEKYGKTTPQIVLRWLVDRGAIPVPKTINPKRLAQNMDIFDFKLDQAEIEQINSFNVDRRYTLPSFWQTHQYYPFEKVEKPIADPFV